MSVSLLQNAIKFGLQLRQSKCNRFWESRVLWTTHQPFRGHAPPFPLQHPNHRPLSLAWNRQHLFRATNDIALIELLFLYVLHHLDEEWCVFSIVYAMTNFRPAPAVKEATDAQAVALLLHAIWSNNYCMGPALHATTWRSRQRCYRYSLCVHNVRVMDTGQIPSVQGQQQSALQMSIPPIRCSTIKVGYMYKYMQGSWITWEWPITIYYTPCFKETSHCVSVLIFTKYYRFSNFLHRHTLWTICNKVVINHPTTP